MRRQSFVEKNHSVVHSPIYRGSPELWRASIQYKALAFRHSRRVKTFAHELKAVRAVWDESLGPSGGWRCPEGTQFGGYITDRFGRGCGWGIARRIGNAISDTGRRLEGSLDRRRANRNARSTARRLRRATGRRRGERRGLAQQEERLEGEAFTSATPLPDDAWVIERFLNDLADLLAPQSRQERPARPRTQQELDDAVVNVPRPTVDRPSDQPIPITTERVRTRRPLVDPENANWSTEKASAVRTAYNRQRDLLEQEWRRRLRLGPDDDITVDMVNDYVDQRRAQGRAGGYVARLRAMADSWAVMRDPVGGDDDLIDRLNRLNPRRGRQILDEADSNLGIDADQKPVVSRDSSVEREPIRIPPEEVEVIEPDRVWELGAAEEPDIIDVQESGSPAQRYEDAPLVGDMDFSAMQGNTEEARTTADIIRRLNQQAAVLRGEFNSASGVNREERARILLARARRLYRDSREAYDAIRYRRDEPIMPLLQNAQRYLHLAQSMEKIVDEVGAWIDGLDHVLPESPEEIDLAELASIDIPGLSPNITDEYGTVDRLIEQTQAGDGNNLDQLENRASRLISNEADRDVTDNQDMSNGRSTIAAALKDAVNKLARFSAFNRFRKSTASDGRGRYRHLPPLYQNALYRTDFNRHRIFRDALAAVQSIFDLFQATDQTILDSDLESGPVGGHVGDPRVYLETLRGIDRDLYDQVYNDYHVDSQRKLAILLDELVESIRADDGERTRFAVGAILEELSRASEQLFDLTGEWSELEVADSDNPDFVNLRIATNVKFRIVREHIHRLMNLLDDIDALNLHDHSDRRPLLDRDPNPDSRRTSLFEAAKNRGASVGYYQGSLFQQRLVDGRRVPGSVWDEDPDFNRMGYPIPGPSISGTSGATQEQIPPIEEIDYYLHISEVDDDRNLGGILRERSSEVDRERYRYENAFLETPGESIIEKENLFERLENLRKELQAAITESEATYNDETQSYNDRIIAGYRVQLLRSLDAQVALRKLVSLEELIAEDRRRLGAAAPPLRNIPDRPTLDDIEDDDIRLSAQGRLLEIEGDWGDEVIEAMRIRSTEDLIDSRIALQNQIKIIEANIGSARYRDYAIKNSILADRLRESLDRVEDLIDARKQRMRDFIDLDAVLGVAIPDDDYNDREKIEELVDFVVLEAVSPRSLDPFSEREREDLETTLRRVYRIEKEQLTRRLSESVMVRNRFMALREELEIRLGNLLELYERDDRPLGDRMKARLQAEAIRKILFAMKTFQEDIDDNFIFDDDPVEMSVEQQVERVRSMMRADGLDPNNYFPRERSSTAVQILIREHDENQNATPAEKAQILSNDLIALRRSLIYPMPYDRMIDLFIEEDHEGFNVTNFLAAAGTMIQDRQTLAEIDELFRTRPELTDFESVIQSTIETPDEILSNDSAKARRQRPRFATRMLSGFRNFVPKRRNRFRGEIANSDGSPRLITNPKITTKDQAVDHVLRGGSLDEVPNHLWHVAIDENSSDLLQDRSTRFYEKSRIGGYVGDTKIYLVRGEDGYPIEQGWVFKGVDEVHDVVGQVLGSWYLYSLGFPVEGAGYDGVRAKGSRLATPTKRHYVILPYVGNALPDGPLFTGVDYGETANYAPGVYLSTYSESGSWMGEQWQPIAARLHGLYASAFLALNDRHNLNAIAARLQDGVVVIPIDLDSSGEKLEMTLDEYIFSEYPDLDLGLLRYDWLEQAESFGEGLQAVWESIRILDEHIAKTEQFLSIGEELFVALLTEGATIDRRDADRIARGKYRNLRFNLQQIKTNRNWHIRAMLRVVLGVHKDQGLPQEEYDSLLDSLMEEFDSIQDGGGQSGVPDFWISVQQELLEYGQG